VNRFGSPDLTTSCNRSSEETEINHREESQSDHLAPKGVIDLAEHGTLAQQYHEFLYQHDPLNNWDDIVPLLDPIEVEGLTSPDLKTVGEFAASCPELASVMSARNVYDHAALKSGLRYAWSRLQPHAHLLNVLEQHFADEQLPSVVLEPGCFTGGLLHFLAMKLNAVPHIAFDLSPGALKVASKFTKSLEHPNPPTWLEANFLHMRPEMIPLNLGKHCNRGLVILSNIVETVRIQFERYAYLDTTYCMANLISYWVNQGCVVLVADRHDAPDEFFEVLSRHLNCENGTRAFMLDKFEAWSTHHMDEEKPIGDWYYPCHYIFGFYPPNAFTQFPHE
jgi:SAM-dependent methyltransferase